MYQVIPKWGLRTFIKYEGRGPLCINLYQGVLKMEQGGRTEGCQNYIKELRNWVGGAKLYQRTSKWIGGSSINHTTQTNL